MALTGDIWKGKTLGRALFNRAVKRHAAGLGGRVLDLAGGGSSYEALLPSGIEFVRTNLDPTKGEPLDFNEPLPYTDVSFDHVFLFNAIYIADDPLALLREIRRILKPHGTALIASPYLQNEMREPHDYLRFTSEGLERLVRQAGFSAVQMEPYGERFSAAANLLHDAWYFRLVRLPVYAAALGLDRIIPARLRESRPAPIGWFCICTK